jgi:ribonuclease HIII
MATNFVCKISPQKAEELKKLFIASGWKIDQPQYTQFRAKEGKLACTVYQSGKLLVVGKEFQKVVTDFVSLIIPIEAPKPITPQEISHFEPHAGIDESGKGDFFGPLVTACAFVDQLTLAKLKEIGVQDSKNIKNDKKVVKIADEIKRIIGADSYSILILRNEKYNELYAKFGNLNKLLAWCHATVLENVLETTPSCKMAISDQFAASKSVVQRALKSMGQQIKLIQMTKAEQDVAVAAASILARAGFVEEMKKLSLRLRLSYDLPKGASARTKEIGREIYKQRGEATLRCCSKTHFKTFQEACQ